MIREVKEETGLEVSPQKLLVVEDLLSDHNRMVKIWFACNVIGGHLEKTQGAIYEGIVEAKWYTKDELSKETVYPSIIISENWKSFYDDSFKSKYLDLKIADF